MREPKEIFVPWGTGWIAPEKGQPEDGIWQSQIYDIDWKVENSTARIEHAKIAFRKLATARLLRLFAVTSLKVDNILVFPSERDNRFLTKHIQEKIISEALDRHSVHVDSDFIEWVLEPAEARLVDLYSKLEEQRRVHSTHLRNVA